MPRPLPRFLDRTRDPLLTRRLVVTWRLVAHLATAAAMLVVGFALADLAGPGPNSDRATPTTPRVEHLAQVLAAREYHVSPVAGLLQAPNRVHDLRTTFSREGVTVAPRRGPAAGDWRWRWTTSSWGRDQLTPLPPVTPVSHLVRVDYRRRGLSEWYLNGRDGLEQGFTVHRRPAGDGPLRIVGTIAGALTPRQDADGVDWVDDDAVLRLRYDKLVTVDARGRAVPGTIDVAGDQIALVIDDRDAAYPLTIDPLVSTPAWSMDGPGIHAGFGARIAPAGDVDGDGFSDVIVGSPDWSAAGTLQYGHAWVLPGAPGGLLQTFLLDVAGTQDGGGFGESVAPAGDVNGDGYDDVLVGMPEHDGGLYETGRVYLYYGSADGPVADDPWHAGSDLSSRFGYSVSTAGDLDGDGHDDIVVGDPFTGTYTSGRISIKYGAPGGLEGASMDWSEMGGYESWLGYAVATAGDVDGDGYDDIVAGAPRYHSGEIDEGALYVYHGSASGVVSPPTIIQGDAEFLGLGRSVAPAGDVNGDGYADVLAACIPLGSAPYDDEVRLYLGGADGLQAAPAWSRSVGDPASAGGWSTGPAGDVNGDGYADVLLSDGTHDGDVEDQGLLQLFLGHHDGLVTEAAWSTLGPEDPDDGHDRPVTAGDVDGDGFSDIIVGAPAHDLDRGRLRCFHGGPQGVREQAGWVTESNQAGAAYGLSVASAGDVNADGFDDVLVGAESYDNGQPNEGAAFLFLGGTTGPTWVPVWWAESNQVGARFGISVASAGDVNGDGLSDVIVGAPGYETAHGVGAVFAWYSADGGIPYGTPDNCDWTFHDGDGSTFMGGSVDCAGDVNGDGFADVIIGASAYTGAVEHGGAAFVFHGSDTGLEADWAWYQDNDQDGAAYGLAVAGIGDMNGDGYSDVAVGAPYFDDGESDEGRVSVHLGSADGVQPGPPWWTAEADQAISALGSSVDGAGDVNGDGYGDIIVGAPWWHGISDFVGAAMLWYGGPTAPPPGTPDNAARVWEWLIADAHFGRSVAGAGDVDADGYDDIVIGCPDNDGTHTDEGFAIVYLGSDDGPEGNWDWLVTGPMEGALFGYSVAGAGDVDGDGYSDILVGAKNYSGPQANEGRAFMYYGGGGRGAVRAARQWQADLVDRLGPLGESDTVDGFGLTVRGRSPRGRGLVRYEYEVEPHGTPFDGQGTVLGPWTAVGAPGNWSDLPAEVTGLTAGTPYVWRIRVVGHSPYFPRSPWQTLSWNGVSEHDLRTAGGGVGVGDHPGPAVNQDLHAHPNPFNPRTTIEYAVPARGAVRLTVVDVRGRRVRTLVDEVQAAGRRSLIWSGDDDGGRPVAAGVYVAVLETAAGRSAVKLGLVK